MSCSGRPGGPFSTLHDDVSVLKASTQDVAGTHHVPFENVE